MEQFIDVLIGNYNRIDKTIVLYPKTILLIISVFLFILLGSFIKGWFNKNRSQFFLLSSFFNIILLSLLAYSVCKTAYFSKNSFSANYFEIIIDFNHLDIDKKSLFQLLDDHVSKNELGEYNSAETIRFLSTKL
ncbi:hypothetical protein FHQ26_00480 [Testudinibacter sp. TR-2022]|uniref:hypothetical protein n=1 Tax=Testudinibacter sp. TR-2022 TaxID=2585029 RepID=UPI001119A722|nr:hypothetical protein [Testudinibacter sp. TR-2022]TNH00419.1 hypothetical protein FHQ22_12065 [Pasteurellaceae bacterium Phil31]TNH06694.1 hypothetical protein FHQ25_12115 [Testudinibacter sp. TR-2022]TNH13012.1 hypothetical protein FHQ26_00480 [Testudinibacter sp. TR-2022]